MSNDSGSAVEVAVVKVAQEEASVPKSEAEYRKAMKRLARLEKVHNLVQFGDSNSPSSKMPF